MKVTCPKCKIAGHIDESKIPALGGYVRCPKCKHGFLIRKDEKRKSSQSEVQNASSELAENYLKNLMENAVHAKKNGEETYENHRSTERISNAKDLIYSKIKENKQKSVLFATALSLLLMLLFPPFHYIFRGSDVVMGHFFILAPPQNRLARVDALPLLVQCLIVSMIGVIIWLVLKKEKGSETKKHAMPYQANERQVKGNAQQKQVDNGTHTGASVIAGKKKIPEKIIKNTSNIWSNSSAYGKEKKSNVIGPVFGVLVFAFVSICSFKFSLERLIYCAISGSWIPAYCLIIAMCILAGLKRYGLKISAWKFLGGFFGIAWVLSTGLYLYAGFGHHSFVTPILGFALISSIIFWLTSLLKRKN